MLRILALVIMLAFMQRSISMQVQMNEDLSKEDEVIRTRWLANKALRCEICHKMVDESYIAADRNKGTKKSMEEIHIVDAIEDLCKFDGAGGAWLRSVKITENDTDDFDIDPIQNVIFRSNCDVSCQTIYRVCGKILENDVDIDVWSGHMLKGGNKAKADQLVCKPVCNKSKATVGSGPKKTQNPEATAAAMPKTKTPGDPGDPEAWRHQQRHSEL